MPLQQQGATQAAVKVIGREQIAEAQRTLEKYKQAKATSDNKIVENFDWYRLHQRDHMTSSRTTEVQPSSAWLFNIIANKHADEMDNAPIPNILPREEGDREEAKLLSDIIPCVLDQNGFSKTYRAGSWYKLIAGTVAYGVFWDSTKLNGLGDISIDRVDVTNLFWEPGITDINKSRNVFSIKLVDNDELEALYPQLKDNLSTATMQVAEYRNDIKADTSEKSVVVDWYYKKRNDAGKVVLHYVKYCGEEVLYATENVPELAQRGWYDDGEFPFVIGVAYPIPDQLTGFGYVDICKDDQEYTDRLRQAILQNTLANTIPRHFVSASRSINLDEFADYTNPFVTVQGNVSDDSIKAIEGKTLPSASLAVLQQTIDEMKETSGTRDVATGGTTSGVTAASAIAAMQEAGSKLSRDFIDASYDTYREIIVKVIERIRQFYDFQRSFRILGEDGAYRFVQYTNAGLQPQSQGEAFGVELGSRVPLFDIEVSAEKKSPYKRISQNELALQFYSAGFFNPQMADQAMAALDMMDFDGKSFVMERIAQQGAMYQAAMAQAVAQGITPSGGAAVPTGGTAQMPSEPTGGEAASTRNARQRVAESTSPV